MSWNFNTSWNFFLIFCDTKYIIVIGYCVIIRQFKLVLYLKFL